MWNVLEENDIRRASGGIIRYLRTSIANCKLLCKLHFSELIVWTLWLFIYICASFSLLGSVNVWIDILRLKCVTIVNALTWGVTVNTFWSILLSACIAWLTFHPVPVFLCDSFMWSFVKQWQKYYTLKCLFANNVLLLDTKQNNTI